jgi:hypothetical protein
MMSPAAGGSIDFFIPGRAAADGGFIPKSAGTIQRIGRITLFFRCSRWMLKVDAHDLY